MRPQLSFHQFAVLTRCASGPRPTSAVTQNETRALVKLGYLVREKRRGETVLAITSEGLSAWSREMAARGRRQ